MHSTGTDEQTRKALLWDSLVKAGLPNEAATQFVSVSQPAPPPSLVQWGGDVARQTGNAALKGVGDLMNLIGQGMTPGGPMMTAAAMPGATAGMEGLVNQILPAPEPSSAAGRIGLGAVRAGTSGVAGGPMGALAGAASGAAGQGTAELGANPLLQMLASLAAGGAVAGTGSLVARGRPAAQAGRVLSRELVRNEQPTTGVPTGSTPVSGREALGPAGQSIALRVAGEGGQGSRVILQHAKNVLEEAPQRFTKAVTDALQHPERPVTGSIDETYKPLVNALYDRIGPQPVQITPEIAQALTSSPKVLQAYRLRARDYNVGKSPEQRIPLTLTDAEGKLLPEVPLRALDEIKRGFDLAAGGKPGSGSVAATQLNNQLVPLIDAQIPEYPIARSIAQEQINLKQAARYVGAKPAQAAKLEASLSKYYDPEQISQLKLIRDQMQQTVRGAKQVQAAGEPRPAAGKNAPLRKLIAEFVVGMRRALARDVTVATQGGRDYDPAVRQLLADLLSAQGPAVTQQADALRTAAARPSQLLQQGALGTLLGAPPR